MTHEGDIHVAGDMKVAWFTDPDGNILNLASRYFSIVATRRCDEERWVDQLKRAYAG